MKKKVIYIHSVIAAGLLTMSIPTQAQSLDSDTAKVNVAFKSVSQADLLGGVGVVNMPDLLKKNYSTYSLDNMAAYVGGYNGQLWNMGDMLVLVDGVPRDANNILPTEIEQITFLKSARQGSCAYYHQARPHRWFTSMRSRQCQPLCTKIIPYLLGVGPIHELIQRGPEK